MTDQEIEQITAFNRMWAEIGALVLPRFISLCNDMSVASRGEWRPELSVDPVRNTNDVDSTNSPGGYRGKKFGLAPVSQASEVVVFVKAFLSECAEHGETYWTETANLRRNFEAWRMRVGAPPISQTALGRALGGLGYSVYHGHRRRWYGFRLPDLARVERGASEGR